MRSTDVIHSVFVPAEPKKDIVPGRYNYMWFKPTVASEKVSDEELQAAIKTSKEDWDYDRWQFTKDGYKFDLYCTEYCGTNHSKMQTVVEVVHETLEDLNAWIDQYSKRSDDVVLEEYGKTLYEQRGCKGCHSLDGSKRVGPSFIESYGNQRPLANDEVVLADENYIRESILYPKEKGCCWAFTRDAELKDTN